MTAIDAFADILNLPDGLNEPDEPWHICPRDKNPATEFQRQATVLGLVRQLAPSVFVTAIPNGSKDSDWSRIRKHREGMVSGMPDLLFLWNRGGLIAEMKAGGTMPSRQQRAVLNTLYRLGWRCGVYRNPDTLIAHLREAGAPFVGRVL